MQALTLWKSLVTADSLVARNELPRLFREVTRAHPPCIIHPMPVPARDVAAFILAGGKSTRMGTDKAFVELEGHTLLSRALDIARSVTPNVSIVGDPGK